ncbi:thiE protein [alpha proteobacterium IMCC14465]|uniref:Thiamine-phosphate synthase n=1 Tax=alpha proteobacterium IMCC14465 TaxID=1220535 RepID=J9E2I7_9PROT|nr:thiE protein [alpha proteobacterium IMCC14465]
MQCRLYLITPPAIDLDRFPDLLDKTLAAGDVACLQLRLKRPDETPVADGLILQAAEKLLPIAHKHDVSLLINDRADLALTSGADGVHIGQEDTPYAEARQILGQDSIIGVTCHDSRHLAMVAGEDGADYVAFGAFFPTSTKTPSRQADPELLTWWQETTELPCVAIGGITTDNAASLIKAGADFLAVSGGVWGYAHGPEEAVKAFNALFLALDES